MTEEAIKRERYQSVRRATFVTGIAHIMLGLAKVFFGVVGHSQALVADGLHSFADLLTDGMVIIAARIGSQAADADHPYGHERIETAVAVALSIVLALVGLGIFFDAGFRLLVVKVHAVPSMAVVIVAVLSVLANEALFHYLKRVARRAQSQLLQTNAWHCRSDAASSLVVLGGVIGAKLGLPMLDAVAAIVVSVLIVKMAWDLGWPCIRELVDTGVEPATVAAIKKVIEQTAGIDTLHQLRTRSMAGAIFVDVHVLVGPKLSVSEGHFLGESVRFALLEQVAGVKDVTVHVDPEDDELVPPTLGLPSRQQVLADLAACWQTLPDYQTIHRYNLHYLNGKVEVEIFFPVTVHTTDIVAQYQQAAAVLPYLATLTLWGESG